MEGVQVDLHAERTVTPFAQPQGMILFSVRPNLETEVERLIADDVIEKVEEPTGWVYPVVITPKRRPTKFDSTWIRERPIKPFPGPMLSFLLLRISHMSSMEQLFSPTWK